MDDVDIRGHVVVLMAPTGSGKSTLVKHLLATYENLYVTVSCTTRARRPGETEGKEYYFLSHDAFEAKIAEAAFLEWANFGGNLYGTLKSEILPRLVKPQIVLAEIELQGVEQLRQLLPREHLTVVYIDAGDWEVLKARALARAPMSETELALRYERYLVEREARGIADVVVDNTDQDLDRAKSQINAVIENILANF